MKQQYIKPEVITVIKMANTFLTQDTEGNLPGGGGGANENMFDQNNLPSEDETAPSKSLWED